MIDPPFESAFDEAQLAASSFLARYSGRTLEAYRHDLREFFQWATDTGLDVLGVSRGHIELFRSGCSCSPPSSTTATMLRWRCCSGSTGCRSVKPAPPTWRISASSVGTALGGLLGDAEHRSDLQP